MFEINLIVVDFIRLKHFVKNANDEAPSYIVLSVLLLLSSFVAPNIVPLFAKYN
jgi:hypothetical protein